MRRTRLLTSLGHHALLLMMLFAGSAFSADKSAEMSGDEATRMLLSAADTGSLARVEEALRHGARIDESRMPWTGADGQPALVAAALRGHASIVSLLLERGGDPLVTEKDGFNVWHAAAFQGHPSVLRILIDAEVPGYGINQRDGFTPLHRASWGRAQRHFQAVKLLVTKGGRACDEPDRAGRSAAGIAKNPQAAAWLKACSAERAGSAERAESAEVPSASAAGTNAAKLSGHKKGTR